MKTCERTYRNRRSATYAATSASHSSEEELLATNTLACVVKITSGKRASNERWRAGRACAFELFAMGLGGFSITSNRLTNELGPLLDACPIL